MLAGIDQLSDVERAAVRQPLVEHQVPHVQHVGVVHHGVGRIDDRLPQRPLREAGDLDVQAARFGDAVLRRGPGGCGNVRVAGGVDDDRREHHAADVGGCHDDATDLAIADQGPASEGAEPHVGMQAAEFPAEPLRLFLGLPGALSGIDLLVDVTRIPAAHAVPVRGDETRGADAAEAHGGIR